MLRFGEKIENKTQLPILTMEQTIKLLKGVKLDEKRKFLEIEILGEITPGQIKALLNLPYEVALTENDNKVILTTGSKGSAGYLGPESQYKERRDNSKLSFHTHQDKEEGLNVNTPSFTDVILTDFAKAGTPLLLAHKNGLILYGPPKINPITGQPPEENAKYTAMEFCFENGFNVFSLNAPMMNDKKSPNELPLTEQLKLAREFAEKSGMIIKEASWAKGEDKEVLAELMKYINLQQ